MEGLSERQEMVLMMMAASCSAVVESDVIAGLAELGLAERLGEFRARLTDRGAVLARELILAERGLGTAWDSPRGRALVA